MLNMHFHDNAIFFIGGMTDEEIPGKEDGHLKNEISKYDLPSKNFTPKIKKLPCAIAATASVYSEGYFYLVGGVTSAGFSDCIYKIDLQEMKSSQVLIEKIAEGDPAAKGIIELMSTCCVLTEDKKHIIIFGGSTYENEVNCCFGISLARFNELEGPVTKNLVA